MMRAVARDDRQPASSPDGDPRIARWGADRWGRGTVPGSPFPCPLSGHSGFAQIERRPRGCGWSVRCSCDGADEWLSVSGLWAAECWAKGPARRGDVFRLSPYQQRLWRLRLLHELGIEPVVVPGAPDLQRGAPDADHRVLAGLALLTALVTAHDSNPSPDGAEPYSARFAEAWTGVPRSTASRSLVALVEQGVIRRGPPLEPTVGRNRPTATYALSVPAPIDLGERRRSALARDGASKSTPPAWQLSRIARYVVPWRGKSAPPEHRRPNGKSVRRSATTEARVVEDAVYWSCGVCGGDWGYFLEHQGGAPLDGVTDLRCGRCDPPAVVVWVQGTVRDAGGDA